MTYQSTGFVLVAGVALVVSIVLWSVLNRPVDTGHRIKGHVAVCNSSRWRRVGNRWCLVQPDDGSAQVRVFMPAGHSGERVVVAEERRAITDTAFYDVAP